MKTMLTKIGNSKGVIIPARILRDCRFDNVVSVEVKNETLVISKPAEPRSGWAEAFAKAVSHDQELLIDDTLSNQFDNEEWTW